MAREKDNWGFCPVANTAPTPCGSSHGSFYSFWIRRRCWHWRRRQALGRPMAELLWLWEQRHSADVQAEAATRLSRFTTSIPSLQPIGRFVTDDVLVLTTCHVDLREIGVSPFS